MKICFLDNLDIPYTSKDIDSVKLRGGENIIINLSRELVKLGNDVIVYNNCKYDCEIDGVNWSNIKNINNNIIFDIAITNNDINLLNKIKSKKYLAFSYSIQSLEKFVRKRQLLNYIKYKPKIILLGNYHSNKRNKLLKIFGSFITELGVDEIFINSKINDDIVENRAIFTSRKDRNLNLLINIWKNYIFLHNKTAKLFVTPSNLIDNEFNIFERNFTNRNLLIDDMLKSKVLLIPGHKAELFCLAAEEARELCIPVVTLGIGSLSERVIHGKTGFIAKNNDEFAKFALDILENNSIWQEIRNNLVKLRGSKKWSTVTSNLLKLV